MIIGYARVESGGEKVGHGSGGMSPLLAAKKSSTFTLSGDGEGGRIFTVDLYATRVSSCRKLIPRMYGPPRAVPE